MKLFKNNYLAALLTIISLSSINQSIKGFVENLQDLENSQITTSDSKGNFWSAKTVDGKIVANAPKDTLVINNETRYDLLFQVNMYNGRTFEQVIKAKCQQELFINRSRITELKYADAGSILYYTWNNVTDKLKECRDISEQACLLTINQQVDADSITGQVVETTSGPVNTFLLAAIGTMGSDFVKSGLSGLSEYILSFNNSIEPLSPDYLSYDVLDITSVFCGAGKKDSAIRQKARNFQQANELLGVRKYSKKSEHELEGYSIDLAFDYLSKKWSDITNSLNPEPKSSEQEFLSDIMNLIFESYRSSKLGWEERSETTSYIEFNDGDQDSDQNTEAMDLNQLSFLGQRYKDQKSVYVV